MAPVVFYHMSILTSLTNWKSVDYQQNYQKYMEYTGIYQELLAVQSHSE